jgi:hypothetical protein
MYIKKIISKFKPTEGANGQYNYDSENGVLDGISNNPNGGGNELYSLYDPFLSNESLIQQYPGFMWPNGFRVEINQVYLDERNNYDTVDGRLRAYFYDEKTHPGIDTAGDGLTSYVSGGHQMLETLSWNNGCHDHNSSKSNVYVGNNYASGWKEWNGGSSGFNNAWFEWNLTGNGAKGGDAGGISTTGGNVVDQDIEYWSNVIQGGTTVTDRFYIVIMMEGNAEETGYCNTDERNNSYQKFAIPKKYFYDLVHNKKITHMRMKWGSRFCSSGCTITTSAYPVGYFDVDGNEIPNDELRNPLQRWSRPTLYQDTHGHEGSSESGWWGDDKKAAAYECDGLVVTIYGPGSSVAPNAYDLDEYPGADSGLIPPGGEYDDYWGWLDRGTIDFSTGKVQNKQNMIHLNPLAPINYMSFVTGEDDSTPSVDQYSMINFRPISFVSIGNSGVDLQQFYPVGDDYYYTTAPNTVNLTFRISEESDKFYPDYIDGYDADDGDRIGDITKNIVLDDEILGGQRWMFYVYDWEASDLDVDWDEIINDLPNNYSDILFQEDQGVHDYTELFTSDEEGNHQIHDVEHTYDSAGLKIIKAVVFSYMTNQDDPNLIHTLKWRAVVIRLLMGVDGAFVEDFSDLGGNDYKFIPWPETTALVGGVSEKSTYVQTVENIIQTNYFNDDELIYEGLSRLAYANTPGQYNDELGDHVGKVDVAQIRYFNTGSYDMNDLLNLQTTGSFRRYDDWNYWYDFNEDTGNNNGMPQYPKVENEDGTTNSCVGLLFIDEDSMIERKNHCIVEYNTHDLTNITIHDSSGHDNRGIIMGDYALQKSDYGVDITREEPAALPEVDVDEKAF